MERGILYTEAKKPSVWYSLRERVKKNTKGNYVRYVKKEQVKPMDNYCKGPSSAAKGGG